jgi:hypothetical protein
VKKSGTPSLPGLDRRRSRKWGSRPLRRIWVHQRVRPRAPPLFITARYRPAMVAMSEDFRSRWERERERREEAELIDLATLLKRLFCPDRFGTRG